MYANLVMKGKCNRDIHIFFLQNEGQTALHLAAIMGDEQYIKFLHMVGAKPNLQDKQERTPLHLATENGHMKTVDFLTEKFRASVHERTKVCLSKRALLLKNESLTLLRIIGWKYSDASGLGCRAPGNGNGIYEERRCLAYAQQGGSQTDSYGS